MKPIFGLNLKNDDDEEIGNSVEFTTLSLSEEEEEKYNEATEELERADEKAGLHWVLSIIEFIFGGYALLYMGAMIKADVSFAERYRNAPTLFWLAVVAAAIFIPLFIADRVKRSKKKSDPTILRAKDKVKTIERENYEKLGVPESAANVDIFFFSYKEKENGEIPLKNEFVTPLDMKIFVENGNLCLSDVTARYEFPLSELTAIKTENVKVTMSGWNKSESFYDGKYADYKIKKGKNGVLSLSPVHILELERNGEKYGIYFPCYELDIFEELTGLRAE